jgi:hypothetical protein
LSFRISFHPICRILEPSFFSVSSLQISSSFDPWLISFFFHKPGGCALVSSQNVLVRSHQIRSDRKQSKKKGGADRPGTEVARPQSASALERDRSPRRGGVCSQALGAGPSCWPKFDSVKKNKATSVGVVQIRSIWKSNVAKGHGIDRPPSYRWALASIASSKKKKNSTRWTRQSRFSVWYRAPAVHALRQTF